jgi:hypothetical protein
VLQVFCTFGVQFKEEAGSVQLAKALNLLNGSNLVIETRRIVNTLKVFGFQLFFEAGLLVALVM